MDQISTSLTSSPFPFPLPLQQAAGEPLCWDGAAPGPPNPTISGWGQGLCSWPPHLSPCLTAKTNSL